MVKLAGTFSHLGHCKVLVIGDLMLDTYTKGKVERVSPESPVVVVHVREEEDRPGGAGNVVLNLISLGAEVVTVGRVGGDSRGERLVDALQKEEADVSGIVVQPGYATPVKNRIIADNQQVVRVDYEQIVSLPELLEQQVIESLPTLLEGVQVIALSDYGKGFLTRTLLAAVIKAGREKGIPLIADPKGVDFTKYKGVTLIKPNQKEAFAAANLPPGPSLDEVAARILPSTEVDALMVTRSKEGISLFYKDGQSEHFPVHVREVNDVTGAGDTVLAMLSCALANGLSIAEGAQLSNFAAGIAIEHFGCARVTLSDLARRLLVENVVNKVFEEEHLSALQEALRGHCFVVLGVSGAQGLTSPIFHAICQLSACSATDLILYIRDRDPDPEFVNLLSSLHHVDFIILKSESLRALCERIHPEEVYVLNQDQELEKQDIFQLSHDR